MKIQDDFIRGNSQISIISNNGSPISVPSAWGRVLADLEMLVIIPDMHMYFPDREIDNFHFGLEAMNDFLEHLDDIQGRINRSSQLMKIYQIGDMFEQRYPGKGGANATSTDILTSSPEYDSIYNSLKDFNAGFLYGNHDFEMRNFSSYKFCDSIGKVYLEHGFTPDKWDDFSNPNDPFWEISQVVFKGIREVNEALADIAVDVGLLPKDDCHAISVRSGRIPDYSYPGLENYKAKYKTQYDYYSNLLPKIKSVPDARICVIGHTHMPCLDAGINNGEGIYIDSGAWTEGRSDFSVITNEEIAICCYKRRH